MSRLVIFMFAGRRANMEVQMPYLHRILDTHPEAELHLWDLTRDPMDQRYLRGLEGSQNGRVRVLGHLHGGHPIKCRYPKGFNGRRPRGFPPCTCMIHRPLFEEPYKWYAAYGIRDHAPTSDDIYVKVDDDVLFLETERFDDLIAPLAEHPHRVISANVINNAVCAKYAPDALLTANQFAVGDPADPANDKRWWNLHTLPLFAQWSHDRFLANVGFGLPFQSGYVRTRPGEAISINCIAFTHSTMRRLAAAFSHDHRLGDEGVVDRMLPWIALSFHAAHLTFGPQDQGMDPANLNVLRERYAQLSKEYLQ